MFDDHRLQQGTHGGRPWLGSKCGQDQPRDRLPRSEAKNGCAIASEATGRLGGQAADSCMLSLFQHFTDPTLYSTGIKSSNADVFVSGVYQNVDGEPDKNAGPIANNDEYDNKLGEQENSARDRRLEDDGGGGGGETSVTLSRGFLQMMTEGDFAGGDTDCRQPHFPQNVYIFSRLHEKELEAIDPNRRYEGPDAIGRFSKSSQGMFVAAQKDRHNPATYSAALGRGQQLGTTGGRSGVTIGLGIDIGNRWSAAAQAEVKAYFVAGGVAADQADLLAGAAGVKGIEAARLAATLRSQIRLTDDQVLKTLRAAVAELDHVAKGFKRGDGRYHPVIEEVIYYSHYWGESKLRALIIAAVNGLKANEQLAAARDALSPVCRQLEQQNSWKRHGYKSILATLSRLADMIASGVEIKVSDMVMDKDELAQDDTTFRLIQDSCERRDDYKVRGKDLKQPLLNKPIEYLISASVGSGPDAKNGAEDVRTVQRLLRAGGYSVEVTGEWDEASREAAKQFMADHAIPYSATMKPDSRPVRALKQFQYGVGDSSGEGESEAPSER